MGLGVRLYGRTSSLMADSWVYFQTRASLLLCRCASMDFHPVDDIDARRLQPLDLPPCCGERLAGLMAGSLVTGIPPSPGIGELPISLLDLTGCLYFLSFRRDSSAAKGL
jgi:hypothetical protein